MWFKLVCYASIFLCWLVGHPEFQNPHALGTEGYINQETIHSSPSDQILLISDPHQGLSWLGLLVFIKGNFTWPPKSSEVIS